MNSKIITTILQLLLISGCANTQYQLGADPQQISACDQSKAMAYESNKAQEKCHLTNQNLGEDALLLEALSYTASFSLGASLF